MPKLWTVKLQMTKLDLMIELQIIKFQVMELQMMKPVFIIKHLMIKLQFTKFQMIRLQMMKPDLMTKLQVILLYDEIPVDKASDEYTPDDKALYDEV